jgi:predicted phosphodiesterase
LKILVLSDIHYPITKTAELVEVIKKESAHKTIFLGDSIVEGDVSGFKELIEGAGVQNPIFIIGDNEIEAGLASALPFVESLKLTVGSVKFTFIHGHQFNIRSDGVTGWIARIFKKIDKRLPLLAYSLRARMRSHTDGYLVLGHCHALTFFPRIKVATAGCLATAPKLFRDRGYIVIQSSPENEKVSLLLKNLDEKSESRTFEI